MGQVTWIERRESQLEAARVGGTLSEDGERELRELREWDRLADDVLACLTGYEDKDEVVEALDEEGIPIDVAGFIADDLLRVMG